MIDEINNILSKWDPIDVGYPSSSHEYTIYAQKIKLMLDDKAKLKLYLIEAIKQMGLTYDHRDRLQEKSIDDVIQKLIELKKKW